MKKNTTNKVNRSKMVETVDKMTLPNNGTIKIHKGKDPVSAIKLQTKKNYKFIKIPLANGGTAILTPDSEVTVTDNTHFEVTNAHIEIKDKNNKSDGSYVLVYPLNKVVLNTTNGDIFVPKKNNCYLYTRVTKYNKDYYAASNPEYAKLTDKELANKPIYANTLVIGESSISKIKVDIEWLARTTAASRKNQEPKEKKVSSKPSTKQSEADMLKERRFKKFMKTGLTMDGLLLSKCGIKLQPPVPKDKRTRELFEELDSKMMEVQKKIEAEDRLISECYFGGKPMEFFSKATEKKISNLARKHTPIKVISEKTKLREDTIAFALAGGYQRSNYHLLTDAKLYLSAIRLDSKMYEEAYTNLMNLFSVKLLMDRIVKSDKEYSSK